MALTSTRRIVLLASMACVVILASWMLVHVFRSEMADRLSFLLTSRGMQLSDQAAYKLEQDLKSDNDSFAYRIELLAFYSSKTYREGLTPEESANRREHVLWIIQHQPSSEVAGSPDAAFTDNRDPEGMAQGKKLWLQQIQANPNNVRILYNAGRFFSWNADWEQSKEFIERAYAIAPKDHDVASFLAEIYWRDARKSQTAEQLTRMAAKSLQIYDQALKDAPDARERLYDLPDAAQAAFEAGDYDRAAAYAKDALDLVVKSEDRSSIADATHYGNIVLGRIALRRGDTVRASGYLLKAAEITGNPHLDTFGPNMLLAKELLDRGDRKSVVTYFDLCRRFWTDDDGKLGQWRSAVLAGQNPDFGANLRY